MKKYKTSTIVAIAIAGFMVVIMLLSPLMAFFWGGNDDSDHTAQPTPTPDDRIPLSRVGKLIDHRFDSIADGLNMSPPGVIAARYISAEGLERTPLEPLMYPQSIYGTNISQGYLAMFGDGTQVELHTLNPRKFSFGFIVSPGYHDYPVLIRNKDICNIMGDPCIMGPRGKVEETVDVIENENASNSYPYFRELLEQVDLDAPVQMVTMYSPVARQYYDAMRAVDGQCERTIISIGITENATARLNELAANTTDEIECNVTFGEGDLNLTIARITGDFESVMGAEIY
ncbi:MAG: hypothetical protein U9N07_08520 [Euryarchaeota archaeon]|nr:hypothetical protein [Euryarchaeota archaeon]